MMRAVVGSRRRGLGAGLATEAMFVAPVAAVAVATPRCVNRCRDLGHARRRSASGYIAVRRESRQGCDRPATRGRATLIRPTDGQARVAEDPPTRHLDEARATKKYEGAACGRTASNDLHVPVHEAEIGSREAARPGGGDAVGGRSSSPCEDSRSARPGAAAITRVMAATNREFYCRSTVTRGRVVAEGLLRESPVAVRGPSVTTNQQSRARKGIVLTKGACDRLEPRTRDGRGQVIQAVKVVWLRSSAATADGVETHATAIDSPP